MGRTAELATLAEAITKKRAVVSGVSGRGRTALDARRGQRADGRRARRRRPPRWRRRCRYGARRCRPGPTPTRRRVGDRAAGQGDPRVGGGRARAGRGVGHCRRRHPARRRPGTAIRPDALGLHDDRHTRAASRRGIRRRRSRSVGPDRGGRVAGYARAWSTMRPQRRPPSSTRSAVSCATGRRRSSSRDGRSRHGRWHRPTSSPSSGRQ